MRAKDVMTRPVLTVRASDPVERAAAVLGEHDVTSAPVIDTAGDLVGMVSEVDILPELDDPAATNVVADVMTEDVVVVSPDDDLTEVAKALVDQDVRSAPVMADAEIVGIVSRRDILHSAVRPDEIVTSELQRLVDDYAGEGRRWHVTVHRGVATLSGAFRDEAESGALTALSRTLPGVTAVEIRPSPESP